MGLGAGIFAAWYRCKQGYIPPFSLCQLGWDLRRNVSCQILTLTTLKDFR